MAREVVVKPRNDAYTGLLAISFLALVGATVLMAMDAKDLGDPPPVRLAFDLECQFHRDSVARNAVVGVRE